MPAVNFYHLTRSTPEAALYKLLGKAYEAEKRCLVRFANEADVSAYDTALWTREPEGFLPHGKANNGTPEDEHILLTDTGENINGAKFAFIFPEANDENLDEFERVFFLFEGGSEAQVKEARGRWKKMSEHGFELIYWTQDDAGKWSKKEL